MQHPELTRTVLDFLNRHVKKMVLTVLDEKGAPNSSLMHYAIDDDMNFFMGTKKGFGKYAVLKRLLKRSLFLNQRTLRSITSKGQMTTSCSS